MLSQDTACQRLTEKGHALGLITKKTFDSYLEKENKYQDFLKQIKKNKNKTQQQTHNRRRFAQENRPHHKRD